MTRQPRTSRVGAIPGGAPFAVTLFPDTAARVEQVTDRLPTTDAEVRRLIVDAGLALLDRARAAGLSSIADVDALLACPGHIRIRGIAPRET